MKTIKARRSKAAFRKSAKLWEYWDWNFSLIHQPKICSHMNLKKLFQCKDSASQSIQSLQRNLSCLFIKSRNQVRHMNKRQVNTYLKLYQQDVTLWGHWPVTLTACMHFTFSNAPLMITKKIAINLPAILAAMGFECLYTTFWQMLFQPPKGI